MLLLLHSCCPKPVQISGLGTGTWLLRTEIADWWLRKEYSVRLIIRKLEQVVMHRNAILFQLVLWLEYLQTSLFITIYLTAGRIISPVDFANKVSHVQYKLWESHDLTLQSVIIYIYLCGQICASCLKNLIFQTVLLYWTRHWTEMEDWHTNPTYLHFIIYRQLVRSPF
jgi:hypothetical protein